MLSKAQRVFLFLASALYIGAGTLHFLETGAYLRIMPPYIPWPLAMVYISGLAEILGGVGLLIPVLRRAAAWGLAALLVAVLPANIYMATNNIQLTQTPIPQALLWARVPLQIPLIWWVLWCSRER